MCQKNCQIQQEITQKRHTASHIMSFAVKMMFPDVQMGVGPWTKTGFYQDYLFSEPISADIFKKIEKKIRWIINKDFLVQKREVSANFARNYFKNDVFKLELIEDLVKKGEKLTFYDFIDENLPENNEKRVKYSDLCAGPHVSRTGDVKVIKIMKTAGAYWRGDAEKAQLTRLYGVTFDTKDDLDVYLDFLKEAEARDHRKLGKELDLFTFSGLVGPGLPLFTPKGAFLRNKIAETIQNIQEKYGYTPVWIPHITKKDLYETSGHWGKYKDDLFHVKGKGETEFVMKPMNCPHHTQIFASKMRSYRELPLRYSEVTTCYRDELPGELLGLSRVRSLTQDDGHAFCTMDQIETEVTNVIKIVKEFYQKMGMWPENDQESGKNNEKAPFRVTLSVRDPQKPEKYLGKPENWDQAEAMLLKSAEKMGLNAKREEGEAAFYGPKLDFQFEDALGREWQLATVQLDFVMPERFDLSFINAQNTKERPVMIHRAVAGSLERFLSVIIEHFAGAFPLWLAPVQGYILPVTENHVDYAFEIQKKAKETQNARLEVLLPSDTLGKRLRKSQTEKIPLSVIVGDTEMTEKTVTIRKYGEKRDETMNLVEFEGVFGE